MMTDIANNQTEVWDSAQHSEGRDSAHQISDKQVSYVFTTFNSEKTIKKAFCWNRYDWRRNSFN